MRIREIALLGFKSFREPARLAFSPGLNAIVGPNGCGKSNVADAIRWVLGEQSVKHLRARGMEDVIFGGNSRSHALNFAEVSLTFEQPDPETLGAVEGDGDLAARIAQLPEFTVTRRFFRSGDSEYLINQAPARLRDITELFLGTGVGPKAYAIIEQGRVDQMVNAKPEEMRLFIEEAAGTTRFRSRRLAAERKLERTLENLSRVQDVLREIERQLATLRRQARRAEEFKGLEAELRATEITLAAHRRAALDLERRAAREAAEALSLRIDDDDVRARDAESARAAAAEIEGTARTDLERAFQLVAEASSTLIRVRERRSACGESLGAVDARAAELERDLREIADGQSDLEERLRVSMARRSQQAEEAANAADALAEAETALADAVPGFERARDAHAIAVSALRDLTQRASRASAARSERVARATTLEAEFARLAERRAEREGDLLTAQERSTAGSDRLVHAKGVRERLSADRISAAAAVEAGSREVQDLEASLGAVREGMLHVRGRFDALRESEDALEGYGEGVARLLADELGARGLVVDALVIPSELERPVAAVLGDVLKGALVDSPETAAVMASSLREAGAERVALVPLGDHRPPADASLDHPPAGTRPLGGLVQSRGGSERLTRDLFRGVVVVDDLPTAVRAWRDGGDGFTYVTPLGDILRPGGVVVGGRAPEGTEILTRRRALRELALQLDADEIRARQLEVQLAAAREVSSHRGQLLRSLDAEAHEATLALVAAEHESESALRDRAAAARRLEELVRDLERVDAARAAARAQCDLAVAEEAVVLEGMATAEARLREQEGELEARRTEQEQLATRRDGARFVATEKRQGQIALETEVNGLERTLARGLERRTELERRREALAAERESLVATAARLDVEISEARDRMAESEGEVARVREVVRVAQEHLQAAELELDETRRRLSGAREELGALEIRVAERTAQIEAEERHATDRFGVELAGVEPVEVMDEDRASDRVRELRERIARLGDVNVAAIADARELEERHAFLEAQRTDLETSVSDLKRTIGELARTTRARFAETFERADVIFREVFQEMFRGGRASLKLTDPSNPGDSGIELEVQPPGKKLGNLSMLSGGEKAMTAVSLLVALFMLRPTPFCLLDEVDAPLDDANVGRFNAMLRRMGERTQFIIITHNKRTMEAADALYGVTMGEAGVSQVVSVRMPAPDVPHLALAASA